MIYFHSTSKSPKQYYFPFHLFLFNKLPLSSNSETSIGYISELGTFPMNYNYGGATFRSRWAMPPNFLEIWKDKLPKRQKKEKKEKKKEITN